MNDSLLSQLKDIHQPPAVSWWPLAPGWYVVLVILLLLLAFFGYRYYRKQQQHRRRQRIVQHAEQLLLQYQATQSAASIAQLAVLLRRAAIEKFSRETIASLHGEAWLNFLEANSNDTEHSFTQGSGRLLLSAPYQAGTVLNAEPLFALVINWIKDY